MKIDSFSQPSFFEYWFMCPGCNEMHGIRTLNCIKPTNLSEKESKWFDEAKWTFNGNYENPTIHPSVVVWKDEERKVVQCHSFVTDGKIQFLPDSSHKLKGQTVGLPEIEV